MRNYNIDGQTVVKNAAGAAEFGTKHIVELGRCFRCGLCREVCPAFRALGEERFSPRGRLALLSETLSGRDYGRAFAETLDYCLACRACAARCPSGVAGDVLLLAARASSLCRGGLPFFKSWAYRLALPSPRALGILTTLLYFAQKTKTLPAILMFLGLPPRLALPRLHARPFAGRAAGKTFSTQKLRRGTVAYFVGCGNNYLYPNAARGVVNLLTKAGYDVVIPQRLVCCGMPALAAGDASLARRLALTNVRALAAAETVVVDCGSCGTALAEYYDTLLNIPGAHDLKLKVKDFTELVPAEVITRGGEGASKIAYHDSCHLARGFGIREAPRALLAARGKLIEIEPPGAVTCCGGAGTYGLTHPEVFRKIGGERAEAIRASGAEVVAAGCPACVFYLNEALRRLGTNVRAKHTAEILTESD